MHGSLLGLLPASLNSATYPDFRVMLGKPSILYLAPPNRRKSHGDILIPKRNQPATLSDACFQSKLLLTSSQHHRLLPRTS
jgi:hypothetical protein